MIAMTRKSPWPPDYAAALLEFEGLIPPEPPEAPGKRRGRPKVLDNEQLGRLLKALSEINSHNKALQSGSSIAAALKRKADYADWSVRTLRRYVKSALDWEIDLLKRLPAGHPDLWNELLGISAPKGAMTAKVLREKAFELLRHQLQSTNCWPKNSNCWPAELPHVLKVPPSNITCLQAHAATAVGVLPTIW